MKKIVDFMKTFFVDHSAEMNTKDNSKINFWCPSGMIPTNNIN